MTEQILTLWDSNAEPPEGAGLVYTWNGYAQSGGAHSLFRYVESHGERLRLKYLAWIHDLGETLIDGKRVIDHLAFEDSLSYWWMTSLAEKDLSTSPAITDALRLLALEELLIEHKPARFRLVSASASLHEALSGLCSSLGIVYEWQRLAPHPSKQGSPRRIYDALPLPVRALISLGRYLWARRPLSRAERQGWLSGERTLFFCSYFDNIDGKSSLRGEYQSYFWGGLLALLKREGYQCNWLQLFAPSAAAPDADAALGVIRHFNRQSQAQGVHVLHDAYISGRGVLRILKRWFELMIMFRRVRRIEGAFRPAGSRLSVWPIMRGDWRASFLGPAALTNLLSIELFDAAMRGLPHQDKGFYLCENQAWELALVQAWRKHGHGRLIAVEHSTVRFWDLHYFVDPRTVRSTEPHPMPRADLVALNGQAAIDAYRSVDYPQEFIVATEALRYGHLDAPRHGSTSSQVKRTALKVLILGDYQRSDTHGMLQLLEAAAPHMIDSATYTVKPHPNCPVDAGDHPSLRLHVASGPLGEILPDFDVAFAGSKTSAAVDAYLAGLPVVVMLDETMVNFSPLRGQRGVGFISTPEELAEALRSASQTGVSRTESKRFFFLDPELPKWVQLLSW